MLKTYLKNNWWKYIIAIFVIAVDLITKAILVPQNEGAWLTITIIPHILQILPTRNTGAGFSFLSGHTWLLISITAVFLVLFFVFDFKYKKKSKLYCISSALIIAGAIGNLIDRILFGYVRDFIYFQFINFPVFNVADIALTFGIILLLVYVIFYASKGEKADTNFQQNVTESESGVEKNNVQNLDDKNAEIIDNNSRMDEKEIIETNSQNGDKDAKDNN